MADKKFVVKNGLTTQNIAFVDNIGTANNTITVSMLGSDTLSFSGDSGQLLSITDSQSGTIFTVNDISGVPSIGVDADGTISFAETSGNILIGTATDNATDKVQVNGDILATNFKGALQGNANTASALETAVNITLDGAVAGSASFDGSSNVTITTTATADPTLTIDGDASGSATFTNLGNATLTLTIADDSHNHTIANVDNLQTTLDGKLDSGDIGSTVLAYDSNLQSFVTAFTLPTVDGANNQVLTTDGSGNLSFANAPNPLELYAENYDGTSTKPSATGTNAVAIGSGATATGDQSFSFGHGSDATAFRTVAVGGDNIVNTDYAAAFGFGANATANSATSAGRSASASGSSSVALGHAARATGQYAVGIGFNSDALATSSLAIGHNAQTITGSYATALTNSRASGADSFAAAIANNTSSYGATGANSVAIGQLAKATTTRSIAIGGYAQSTGSGAVAIGGQGSGSEPIASGSASIAIGSGTRADASFSMALGSRAQVGGIRGKQAWTGYAITGNNDGASQSGKIVLAVNTTDATPAALTTYSTPNATNQIILPNNSAYFFSGTIVARQQAADGTDMGAWEIKGAIRREGSAGTTVLVNSVINEFEAPTGWSVDLSADTTNGGLAITVTGAAATNIRWVATVHTSEVTYA